MKQLSPADAQVIDFLLDGSGQLDATGATKDRLQAATRVLGLLSAMPEIDGPSTHLLDLTMQRIEDAAGRAHSIGQDQEGTFIPPTGLSAS